MFLEGTISMPATSGSLPLREYYEDSKGTTISPEAVSIPGIITDLQHEKTEEDLAALDATSNSTSTISHTEALTCKASTLIPYLEALPCSSLQRPTS